MWFLIPLVKILSEFVSPGKGLFVAVEEVLVVWQVAELVGGAHLELVVLERCEEQCAVLSPRIYSYSGTWGWREGHTNCGGHLINSTV